jgi:hypothetical protein
MIIVNAFIVSINIYSGKSSKNGLTTYYNFLKSVVSVNIHNVKETVNLREKVVLYNDQTGGKFYRFESGDAHIR